jgi:hypothetical protein
MMLRKPEAAVTPLLHMLREIDCACDCTSGGLLRTHPYKIENRDWQTHISLDEIDG